MRGAVLYRLANSRAKQAEPKKAVSRTERRHAADAGWLRDHGGGYRLRGGRTGRQRRRLLLLRRRPRGARGGAGRGAAKAAARDLRDAAGGAALHKGVAVDAVHLARLGARPD